jgi:hypothetical protein
MRRPSAHPSMRETVCRSTPDTSAMTCSRAVASFRKNARRGQRRSTLVNGGQPPSTSPETRLADATSARPARPSRAAAWRWRKHEPSSLHSDPIRSNHAARPPRPRRHATERFPIVFNDHPATHANARRPHLRNAPPPPHLFIPSRPQHFRQIPRKSGGFMNESATIGPVPFCTPLSRSIRPRDILDVPLTVPIGLPRLLLHRRTHVDLQFV